MNNYTDRLASIAHNKAWKAAKAEMDRSGDTVAAREIYAETYEHVYRVLRGAHENSCLTGSTR